MNVLINAQKKLLLKYKTFKFMSQLKKIIDQIKVNQAEIDLHGSFDEETLKKINYKFRLDWNYYSNRMEGGTLTRAETRSVMVGNLSVHGKPIHDVMEMNGHDQAVLDILKIGKGKHRLSEKRIKELHKAIMYEEDPEKKKNIGGWKKEPNELINYKKEKITFTHPSEVSEKIHEALNRVNAKLDHFFQEKEMEHPIVFISQFHIDYVSIHPFYDGNGRTARLLTNLLLISCGFPPIIIKDKDLESYYKLLADIQVYGGSPDLFMAFMGERLLESQGIIHKTIEGEPIMELDDIDKEISIFKKQVLSKQMTGNVKKNNEIVQEYYDKYFKKLFDLFHEKHALFDELFSDNIYRRSVDNGHPIKYFDSYQEELIHRVASNNPPSKYLEEPISHLAIRVDHKGYKNKGLDMFNMHHGIQIKLDDYQFFIASYNKKEYKFTYTDILTDDFISKYVNDLIKSFLEELKTKTSKA
jgi:Fic family protein